MKNSLTKQGPTFKSREEEARFWDAHSFADYWDELKPVKVRLAKDSGKQNLKPSRMRRKTQIKHMYVGLKTLEGMCNPAITDASTTIDEVLYGENGAWRGTMPPDDEE